MLIWERIVHTFKISEKDAKEITAAIRHAQSGGPEDVDAALELANDKLKGFGVEPLRGEFRGGYYGDTEALYINFGDTYDPTLLYDTQNEKWHVTSWGDFVEKHPKRFEENPPRGKISFKKPYRVETWFERDRSSIIVYDANDREIAEWWDDDVNAMVDSGYFDASGFIMGREVRKGRLEDSVLAYVKEMGLDRAAAKRQKNNPGDVHLDIDIGSHNAARGGRTSVNPNEGFKMTGGDIIKILNVQELPKTGMVTGTRVHYHLLKPAKNAKQIEQIILNRFPYGMKAVSHYSLRPEAYPGVKHAYGILLKGKAGKKNPMRRNWPQEMSWWDKYKALMTGKHDENPPLPASALMDISTAKTVVREVDSGARPPRPALSQADDLLDRGLQKLRGSHLGHVDWSNPPAHKDDVFARHQIKIAKHTLKMSDAGARIMGGMTKEEARAILSKYGIKNSYEENPPATEVYKNIVEIKAVKPDGQRYVHKFEPGSHILGLPNGDLLVQSRKGKRLWKNFETEG